MTLITTKLWAALQRRLFLGPNKAIFKSLNAYIFFKFLLLSYVFLQKVDFVYMEDRDVKIPSSWVIFQKKLHQMSAVKSIYFSNPEPCHTECLTFYTSDWLSWEVDGFVHPLVTIFYSQGSLPGLISCSGVSWSLLATLNLLDMRAGTKNCLR